ncbi:MAG: leucine--tRNA ligase [Oligoflexia bacterium]|nr:leucine--tRNA ligase [Oligoflexia bacterium]
MPYLHKNIEPKWQKFWDEKQVFKAVLDTSKPKYYVLDMFPYPSSSGLHVGHPEGYTATDILARYKRARGFNVLHPMGWDAFGLPAEQYALKTGIHPAKTTQEAIDNFRRQLKAIGFSYDWSREIATCDPQYYKWTQFIFTKLHERGLAYQKEVPVNWCPELKTVLANEEVVDGKSERGGHPVFRVPMKQWMLKITDYADRLLKDLDGLDWPESTKELQRNWIGKSTGLQLRFPIEGRSEKLAETLEVFTTRPDTVFGVTFMVVAPEHPIVSRLVTPEHAAAVKTYQELAARKSEISRQEETKEKTGCFTGAYARNPFSGEKVPIWIADYVMMGYGTGAVMAVPAHDERDSAFAKAYHLPIREIELASKDEVIAKAEREGFGKATVQYKLRDWLFSRQRYWGEPFPIVHLDDGSKKALPLDQLPVVLPAVESYEPSGTGESPLSVITDWVRIKDAQTGQMVRRETDTMPGSAGSSWYFFRYCDPRNDSEFCGKEAEKYWMPVDLYLGGPEHAVGHLLYARFWTKVLFDAGLVTHDEPFKRLVHQGMILGEDGEKMSKSRGNVINPDQVIQQYGADTLRLYEMFMGPLERDKPWSTSAIEGVYRFAQRTWRVFLDDSDNKLFSDVEPTAEDLKITHKTIKKVTEDIEGLRFNTAISQMMIFINHMTKLSVRPRACLRPFVQLLNPFAPHLAEELWEVLGEKASLTTEAWPQFDSALAKDDLITIAVQVMGKTRGMVEIEPGAAQEAVEGAAKEIPQVAAQLAGKSIKKVIFVKDKILNFVVG